MSQNFITAVKSLAKEKNIPEASIIDAIKSALITAYRKDYGNKNQEIEVEFTGESIESATIYLVKEVVEEVYDDDLEISLAEVQKFKKEVEIGDEIRIDVTPLQYGRIATQSAKQVILQKVQELEKNMLFDSFKHKEDSILNAVVNKVEGHSVFLSVDKNTIYLPPKGQVPGEEYFPGKRMFVYLDKVIQTSKGPQLSVSRIHYNLLKKLLEREIPEIASKEILVYKIAREAGSRAKVAVYSQLNNIDAVGSCVGQKGMRINIITDELGGEKIDVIEYSLVPEIFIARSLQPAKIAQVVIINSEDSRRNGKKIKKRAAVFVEESERAMAIGKKGQNIKLATNLTGYELDMYNIEEFEAFMIKFSKIQKQNQENKTNYADKINFKNNVDENDEELGDELDNENNIENNLAEEIEKKASKNKKTDDNNEESEEKVKEVKKEVKAKTKEDIKKVEETEIKKETKKVKKDDKSEAKEEIKKVVKKDSAKKPVKK